MLARRTIVLAASLPLLACATTAPPTPLATHAAPMTSTLAPRPADAQPRSPIAEAVERAFDDSAKAGRFAGAILVADHGEVVLTKAYGDADPVAKRPNDEATIFRIGSMTKQFTAAAILVLEQRGALSIDDPASKYLPEYPKEHLTKNGVAVTLRHLLTHTAGIPALETTELFQKNAWHRPLGVDEMVGAIGAQPLAYGPGTSWAYSNAGYVLLGAIVERVSGKSYEAFAREALFAPAKMEHTGITLRPDEEPRAARGTTFEGDAPVVFASLPVFHDPSLTLAFSAGSVYSSVRDLFAWDRALDGDAILTPASKAKLFAPVREDYACGWRVRTVNGEVTEWHNGAIAPLGFASAMLRVPSRGVFVVYLSNYDPRFVDPDLDEQVEAAVLGRPAPKRVRVAPEVLARYVGKYTLAPGLTLDVTFARGTLFAQATGEPKNALVPESDTTFHLPGTSIQVSFGPDGATIATGERRTVAPRAR